MKRPGKFENISHMFWRYKVNVGDSFIFILTLWYYQNWRKISRKLNCRKIKNALQENILANCVCICSLRNFGTLVFSKFLGYIILCWLRMAKTGNICFGRTKMSWNSEKKYSTCSKSMIISSWMKKAIYLVMCHKKIKQFF